VRKKKGGGSAKKTRISVSGEKGKRGKKVCQRRSAASMVDRSPGTKERPRGTKEGMSMLVSQRGGESEGDCPASR